MTLRALILSLLLVMPLAARAQPVPEAVQRFGPPDAARHLLVRGTTDIPLFAPVIEAFLATRPGVDMLYEQWGSNDLYAQAADHCASGREAADLLITSSVDLAVKLVNDGCAQPHASAATTALPQALNWRNEVFGITREPAVMVYNRTQVPPGDAPATRFDLIDLLRPQDSPYAGRVATYDIGASGLGYLFAFIDSLQATTYGSLLEAFGRSHAVATCCSAQIIDGVASGEYAIAYNVLGSYAVARAAENPDLVVVAPKDYTLVLSRAAMIPRAAENPDDAAALVDFLLSPEGRQVLVAVHLIQSGEEGAVLEPTRADVVERQIALSPILLVGLDQAKRDNFFALWRATFPDTVP